MWLAVLAVVFGGYAVVTDRALSGDPQQVFVVVDSSVVPDSSFDMEAYWREARARLADLDGERYTEYALATEKDLLHTFQPELGDLDDINPFAPCQADDVVALSQAVDADRVVLITSESSCLDVEAPDSWDREIVGG